MTPITPPDMEIQKIVFQFQLNRQWGCVKGEHMFACAAHDHCVPPLSNLFYRAPVPLLSVCV